MSSLLNFSLGYRYETCWLPCSFSLPSARGTLRAAKPIHLDSLAVITSSPHWRILPNISKQLAFWAFREVLVRLFFGRVHDYPWMKFSEKVNSAPIFQSWKSTQLVNSELTQSQLFRRKVYSKSTFSKQSQLRINFLGAGWTPSQFFRSFKSAHV